MSLTKVSYSMISGDFLNILDYGAVGDGSTDNTTAIANAITALASNGGGTLYFPAGTYKYTTFIVNTSNVRILGAGVGITIFQPNGWNDGIRFAVGYPSPTQTINNVGIEYVTVDGTNQTVINPSTGLVDDTYGNGINFNNSDKTYARFNQLINVKGQNIVTTYFADLGSAQIATSSFFTDNTINMASSLEIGIGIEGNLHNAIVSRNIITNVKNTSGSGAIGIYIASLNTGSGYTSGDIIVSNNHISGTYNSTYTTTQTVGVSIQDLDKNIIISDNRIDGLYSGIVGGTLLGVLTNNYVIANNEISNYYSLGIAVETANIASNSIISGNNLLSADMISSGAAFSIYASASTHIVGNRIIANGSPNIYIYGPNCVVNGNYVSNSTTYSLVCTSTTNTTIIGNQFDKAPQFTVGSDTSYGNFGYTGITWTQGYIGTSQSIANPNTNSAPISGTWAVGDKAWNTAPAASGYIGWVCVTAGTPGTWKQFGVITA